MWGREERICSSYQAGCPLCSVFPIASTKSVDFRMNIARTIADAESFDLS